MAINQTDPNLRLDLEEGWKLLYPFTEPGVRRLQVNTLVNLARMAKSNSIVEMVQIYAYLKDVVDLGRRDYRRYPPCYGDPHYIYKPKINGDNWERERDNRVREHVNLSQRERLEQNNACNQYLTPINNLREEIMDKSCLNLALFLDSKL